MSRRNRSNVKRTSKPRNRKKRAAKKHNKEHFRSMLDWLLPDNSIFSKIKLHGNIKWLPKYLVCLALLWAWTESRYVTDAFPQALECYQSMFSYFVPATYQGFMKALSRWTAPLMNLLWPLLHERMEEIGGKFWRINGWVPIAFDGSRSTAPRTKANESAFCAKDYGKGKTANYRKKKSKGMRRRKNEKNKPQPQEPQVWITMLWHIGLRLPWMWRLGPSNSSERAHVMEMICDGKFPKNTLYCGDAGFVGYPLWSTIIECGRHFLVRVGANVSLLKESADCQLGKNGLVLCWPKGMQSKQPPLRLRLVKVRIGKTHVHLLTSVLDPKKLTIKQMIKIYKLRWGIEVEFRGLKQTLDRAKLRCRNDQRLLAELNWSIMAMAVAELFALKEQLMKRSQASRNDGKPNPAKRSLANATRAIRYCIRHVNEIPELGKDLQTMLRQSVTDSYQRKGPKRARYRPPNPDKKPLGKPKVRTITAQERKKLRDIEIKIAA
jgi:hypothetical protein